jgi:hypothetical protein
MKGDGVRLVLDKYGYNCTNKGDREWVITSLEILLALRKTVPSIHTQRQILNAIDNSVVRSCVHREAGVEIDKERGILKANGTTYQFNPLPVEDGFPRSSSEVCIVLVRTANARHQESRAIHWMKNFQEESSQRFYRDFLLKIFPCMWDAKQCIYRRRMPY